ncbi:MAG: hypothetical protein VR73_05605 [Gammaproteobacteria bacterium BRH_c0]|nr:MAG: hypothetical protein VR73_05605 [Gammaproteobacteria bacterium BRH_c0]
MLYRAIPTFAALLFFLLSPFSALASDKLDQQRELYGRATQAIARGDKNEFLTLKNSLKDYPLYAYLEYAEYSADLARIPANTIQRFLTDNEDTPLAGRLRHRWLEHLRHQDRRSDYLTFYHPEQASVEQRCYFYQLNYLDGEIDSAAEGGVELWQEGKSQPNACDPLFASLISGGHISEAVAWRRYSSAVLNHDYALANYVMRFFASADYQQRAKNLIAVDRQPSLVGNYSLFTTHTPEVLSVIAHALSHLATSNAPQALTHWKHYRQAYTFADSDTTLVVTSLVRNLFRQGHTTDADNILRDAINQVDATLPDWRLQQAIKSGHWAKIVEISSWLPQPLADSSRWRYWRARALELNGEGPQQQDEITALYTLLAEERSFYGFLASDTLGRHYEMQHKPVPISTEQLEALANSPAFRRIRELVYHQDLPSARREWFYQLQGQPPENWIAAARLARRWGWHHQAIISMIQAEYWNDVELRFPLPWRENFASSASARNIPLHLLFALSRQESSFEPTIVSPSGARGLMQLMPPTALETARRHGVPYRGIQDLSDPARNIQLGSHYYRQMLDRFNNNRILATAAYNAGPGRVNSWLRQSAGTLPYDAWIETIPFAETRNYVQNVLAFSMIYAHHLNSDAPMLSAAEKSARL